MKVIFVIANEFNSPVYFDKHEGNHSFLITPVEDAGACSATRSHPAAFLALLGLGAVLLRRRRQSR